ncbi:MAG: hypothetical protein EpisKO_07600 [Epibacterium sp.]
MTGPASGFGLTACMQRSSCDVLAHDRLLDDQAQGLAHFSRKLKGWSQLCNTVNNSSDRR